MSRTDKTDPTWVKQRRAKKFIASHNCRHHTSVAWRKINGECDLPAEPYIERSYEKGTSNCSWYADLGSDEWHRMFAAHPGIRTERRAWHRSDRRANRDVNRMMVREYNAGYDVNDDVARINQHHHSGRWDWN